MKSLFTLLLTFLSVQLASAHALWIETNSTGVKNVKQEVRIFYGEYASQEIEPLDKWYSDVKDFKLILTTPSNKQIEVQKMLTGDHFTAEFTPIENGIYVLSIYHAGKDLSKTNLYAFSSLAFIQVSGNTLPAITNNFYVKVNPNKYEVGNTVEAIVIKAGKPLANAEVLVMSQEGWSKSFKTDPQGKISFTALWKGNYVIEASFGENKEGDWNGKPFTYAWEGTTTFLIVN